MAKMTVKLKALIEHPSVPLIKYGIGNMIFHEVLELFTIFHVVLGFSTHFSSMLWDAAQFTHPEN